jgi:thiopeptide-type bacteriocin biosynthesis protein
VAAETDCPLSSAEATDWVQYNIAVGRWVPELYAWLADGVEEMLATQVVRDLFFVHKAPGLRVRFRSDPGDREGAVTHCAVVLAELIRRDFVTGWYPAVYEPEQRLFGGAVSMRSVHRLFTADTLAWLGFHRVASTARMTRWAFSLLTIRSLLDSLEVVGWEDIDVWDRLERNGARILTDTAALNPRVSGLASVIRRAWSNPDLLHEHLTAPIKQLLDRYRADAKVAARCWIADYFTAPGALIGPREAAAYTVIFHWNRGGLTLNDQALITHALASRRPGVPS